MEIYLGFMSAFCALLALIFIIMLFRHKTVNLMQKRLALAIIICLLEFASFHWVLGCIWIGTSFIQWLDLREAQEKNENGHIRIE